MMMLVLAMIGTQDFCTQIALERQEIELFAIGDTTLSSHIMKLHLQKQIMQVERVKRNE
jgi:hypothetical protein